MPNRIRLVLLYGGKSGEHEISLISAASVLSQLDKDKYQVIPIGMDKEGRCFINTVEDLLGQKSLPVSTPSSIALPSLLSNGRFAIEADAIFPVVHGPLYEDGCLQGVLDLAGIAYVGCNVLSSALCMDKDMARRIGCEDIPTARYRALSGNASASQRQQFADQVVKELGWPLFVKPCFLGSSVGIHKAHNQAELLLAIQDASRYDEFILVEEYIAGREIELAVLEDLTPGKPPLVSLAGEIKVHHKDGFYSYTAKYLETDVTELLVPVVLDPKILNSLQSMAATIFTRLKCSGLARIDFFLTADNKIYFNEINTIPGFTPISMYPALWAASGIPYPALLDHLISLAIARQKRRNQLVTSYQ